MTEINAADAAPQPDPALGKASAWTDVAPHPWRRLFARLLDVSLLGWAAMLIISGLAYLVSPDAEAKLVAILDHPLLRLTGSAVSVALSAPLIALLIAWTGVTPGKWLMGVRVQNPDGRRLTVRQAFEREVRAAFNGLALGFPFICLLTLNGSYEALIKRGAASWDAGRHVVVHRPSGPVQATLMIIGVLVWIGLTVAGAIPQILAET